jgi:hypothetical protein
VPWRCLSARLQRFLRCTSTCREPFKFLSRLQQTVLGLTCLPSQRRRLRIAQATELKVRRIAVGKVLESSAQRRHAGEIIVDITLARSKSELCRVSMGRPPLLVLVKITMAASDAVERETAIV